jgi:hypothetical protein
MLQALISLDEASAVSSIGREEDTEITEGNQRALRKRDRAMNSVFFPIILTSFLLRDLR